MIASENLTCLVSQRIALPQFSFLSAAMINTMTKNKKSEERTYLADTFMSRSTSSIVIRQVRSSRQESGGRKQRTWSNTGLLLMACSG